MGFHAWHRRENEMNPVEELSIIVKRWQSEIHPQAVREIQDWIDSRVRCFTATFRLNPECSRRISPETEGQLRHDAVEQLKHVITDAVSETAIFSENKESLTPSLTGKVWVIKPK